MVWELRHKKAIPAWTPLGEHQKTERDGTKKAGRKTKMKESKRPPSKIQFKVNLRRQTAAEEERFNAAINLLLTEWVRQEIEAQGEKQNVQLENQKRLLCRSEAL